jgi:hypothetical protein
MAAALFKMSEMFDDRAAGERPRRVPIGRLFVPAAFGIEGVKHGLLDDRGRLAPRIRERQRIENSLADQVRERTSGCLLQHLAENDEVGVRIGPARARIADHRPLEADGDQLVRTPLAKRIGIELL